MPETANILYQTYIEKRESLLRFFTARAKGNKETAEDIVQEIYLKITRIEHDAKVDNPSAYLFKIGNNIFLNQIRSHTRDMARNNAFIDVNEIRIGDEPISQSMNAEESLSLKEQIQKAQEAIKELPPRDHEIFLACRLEGKTQKQVAEELGISKSSVEKSLAKTLRHLMQILNE